MRVLVLLLASVVMCGLATSAVGQELALEPRWLEVDGASVEVQVGRLAVPQRHDAPDGPALRLAVLVLPATTEEPGPPVFVLNGIPGGATSLADQGRWQAYRALGDVVFVDQRGTGRSEPRLVWDRPPLQAERLFGDEAGAREHALELARTVRAFTEEVGVELAAFNTRESARDLDAVRAALGYETIRLLGHSGGAHLALEYVRQHGERVDALVSLGTAGPGDIHALPHRLDDALRRLADLAAAEPREGAALPDLFARLEAVAARLDEEPLAVPAVHPDTGEAVTVALGGHGLRFLLLLDLADPADFIVFPRMVHELEQGRGDTVGWFVRRRYRQMCDWPALLFVNRGASGASAERWARIREEAATSFFGDTRCLFSPDIDRAFGIEALGDAFRAPVRSPVRALFVSGTLDANTPPEQAEAVRAGFPRSRHLLVENGGHDTVFDHPEVHAAIRAFLVEPPAGEDRTGSGDAAEVLLTLPVPRFALLEGDDPLVEHASLP